MNTAYVARFAAMQTCSQPSCWCIMPGMTEKPSNPEDLNVSRPRFEAILRYHFEADDIESKDIERLYEGWLEIAGDDARINGQESMFEPENAGRLHGVGWYETFMLITPEPEVPEPGADEHVAMYLSSTPPFHVRPRFFCPADLVGKWVLATESVNRGDPAPPSESRTMLLYADGTALCPEEPLEPGTKWCVHHGHKLIEFWLRDPNPPHRHEKHLMKRTIEGMSLDSMGLEKVVRNWEPEVWCEDD